MLFNVQATIKNEEFYQIFLILAMFSKDKIEYAEGSISLYKLYDSLELWIGENNIFHSVFFLPTDVIKLLDLKLKIKRCERATGNFNCISVE